MSSFPQTPVPHTPGAAAAQGWMEDIKKVISFASVEEFWGLVTSFLYPRLEANRPYRLYNHIVPPSQLPQKANYYLFKACRSHCAFILTQLISPTGRYHTCMGRRGKQAWWQMEYTTAEG